MAQSHRPQDSNSVGNLDDCHRRSSEEADAAAISRIVFIDSAVPDPRCLIRGVSADDLVFILAPNRDGVQQIAATLAANDLHHLDAISIVAHGAPGRLTLGSTTLDKAGLRTHADELATIGASLAPGAGILLWSCDVAQGPTGAAFVRALSAATGAPVAAATHPVGSADLGGRWDLDAPGTLADVQPPFSTAALAHYAGLLSGTVFPIPDTDSNAIQDQEQSLAVLPNGNIVVAWYHRSSISTENRITAVKVIAPDGGTVATELNDAGLAGTERFAEVVAIDDTHFAVFATNWGGTNPVVIGRVYTISGSTISAGAVQTFSNPDADSGFSLDAALLPNGNIVLAWVQTGVSGGSADFSHVKVVASTLHVDTATSSFTTLSSQVQISATDTPSPSNLYVSAYGSEVVVGWSQNNTSDSGNSHGYLYHFTANSNGTIPSLVLGNIDIAGSASGSYGIRDLAYLANGDLAVTYVGGPVSGTGSAVGDEDKLTGVVLSHDLASTIKPAFLINTNPQTTGTSLSTLVPFINGGFGVYWGQDPDGTHSNLFDLFGRTFDNTYTATGGPFQITTNMNGTEDIGAFGVANADGTVTLSFERLTSADSYLPHLFGIQLANQDPDLNHAPVASGSATLAAVNEDTANPPGATVSSLFTANFTDSDSDSLAGIAIVANGETTQGHWQYFNGSIWTNVGTSVTESSALIVAGTGSLRFVPATDYNGPAPTLTAHLIDNSDGAVTSGTTVNLTTSGTGGGTVYSAATVALNETINAVNDAPVVDLDSTASGTGFTTTFTEDGAAVAIASVNVSVSDVDSTLLKSATITITNFQSGEDVLAFAANGSTGDITVGSNSGGVLTLTSAAGASFAQWQAALRAVTFSNSSQNPNTADRTITVVLDDGQPSNHASTAAVSTVHVAATNDDPTVSAPASFDATTGAALTVSGITFGDIDSSGATEVATFTVSGGTLAAASSGGVTVSGTATALTLTGSIANLNSFISGGNLTYTTTSHDSIHVVIDDQGHTGTGGMLTASADIDVNLRPTSDETSGSGSEDAAAVTLSLTGSDSDGSVASFVITSLPAHGTLYSDAALSNELHINDAVPGNANAATVYFVPDADWSGSTSFQYAAVDDTGAQDATSATATIDVSPVVDTVSVTALGSGDEDTLIPILNAVLDDLDGSEALTLTLTGFPSGATFSVGHADVNDSWVIDDPADIATLASTSLKMTPPLNFNGSFSLHIAGHVVDSATLSTGSASDSADFSTDIPVTVNSVDDPPAFVGLDNSPTYVEDGPRILLDGDATIVDPDFGSGPYTGATLTLERQGGPNPDDVFGGSGTLTLEEGQVYLTVDDGINGLINLPVGSFTAIDGTLTITFNDNATADRVNAVLQQINYANGNDTPPASVVIDYVFNNGQEGFGSITVTIDAANDAPDVESVAPTALFYPGGSAITLASGITISDPDGTTLVSARVTFDRFNAGDVLAADTGGTGITADFNGFTLTLTGPATLAEFRQVLATVTYTTDRVDPTFGGNEPTRIISWQVDDGGAGNNLSVPETTTVYFAPSVDLDQSGAGTDFSTSYIENGAGVAIVDTDVVVRPGTYTVSSARVVLTNAQDGDVLSVAGSLPGGISSSVDTSVAGQITVVLSGYSSAANYQTALQHIVFSSTSDAPATVARSISVSVGDDNATSLEAVATVDITAVNDAPTTSDATVTALEDTAYAFKLADFPFADTTDASANALASVIIVSLPATGTLSYDGTALTPADVSSGFMVAAADIAASKLVFTPVANANGAGNASFSFEVQDDGGTANGGDDTSAPHTLTINVTAVNDAPAFTKGANQTVTEDAGPQTVAGWATGVSAGPANESAQTVQFIVTGNTNSSLFSAGPAIAPNGTLTYTPAPDAFGTATITVVAMDNGGTANSGADTSAPQTFTITLNAVNDAPRVTAPDATAANGQSSFAAASLFTPFDPDGDQIAAYEFADGTASANSGHWVLNGVTQPADTVIHIAAGDLANMSFAVGSVSDILGVRAFDGQVWSDWAIFHVNPYVNQRPAVTAPGGAVPFGSITAAANLFDATDPDNDAIASYRVVDNTASADSGHFTLYGVSLTANQTYTLTPAQLDELTFVAGSSGATDSLTVSAADSHGFGNPTTFTITTGSPGNVPDNTAPVVLTTADQTLAKNTDVLLTDFITVTDAQGDTITRYQVLENTPGNGHLVLDGVTLPTSYFLDLSAEQFATAAFHTGANTVDTFYVRAFDGHSWGGFQSFDVLAPNATPVVTAVDQYVSAGTMLNAASLFSATDPDSDAILSYQLGILSATGSAGHFTLNGVTHGLGDMFTVTSAQLASLTYTAGSGVDNLWVRASDGVDYGTHEFFSISTQSNQLPVVTSLDPSTQPGDVVAADDLFNVTDPDGGTIAFFQFSQVNHGDAHGHFEIDGVPQSKDGILTITADQLPATTFVAGNGSDEVWMRAFDGNDWGDWTHVALSQTNREPVITGDVEFSLTSNEHAAIADVFSQLAVAFNDADGDAIQRYQFSQNPGGVGHYEIAGTAQGLNIDVLAADLDQVSFVGGTQDGTDLLYVRASDGVLWSNWHPLIAHTEA